MANKTKIEIRDGERIDQISLRAYGTVWSYRQLLEDNPDVDIFYPLGGRFWTVTND